MTLPPEILDANRTVRPDRLEALYQFLRGHADLVPLLPLRPGVTGSSDRMGEIIQRVEIYLGNVNNDSYKFYKMLASQWVYNIPLKDIIDRHITYVRGKGDKRKVSVIIAELMGNLEGIVRFRLVKFFIAYTSILSYIYHERGDNTAADSVEQFHVYLECGACDRIALNLIALGLSRVTALSLMNKINFPEGATPEDCYTVLKRIDLARLRIPALCTREIRELRGT